MWSRPAVCPIWALWQTSASAYCRSWNQWCSAITLHSSGLKRISDGPLMGGASTADDRHLPDLLNCCSLLTPGPGPIDNSYCSCQACAGAHAHTEWPRRRCLAALIPLAIHLVASLDAHSLMVHNADSVRAHARPALPRQLSGCWPGQPNELPTVSVCSCLLLLLAPFQAVGKTIPSVAAATRRCMGCQQFEGALFAFSSARTWQLVGAPSGTRDKVYTVSQWACSWSFWATGQATHAPCLGIGWAHIWPGQPQLLHPNC